VGGKVVINFFSADDLKSILDVVTSDATMTRRGVDALLNRYIEQQDNQPDDVQSGEAEAVAAAEVAEEIVEAATEPAVLAAEEFSPTNSESIENFNLTAPAEFINEEDLDAIDEYQQPSSESAVFMVPAATADPSRAEMIDQAFSEEAEEIMESNSEEFIAPDEAAGVEAEPQQPGEGEDIYSIANFTI
jgi:hypothetical protein